MMELIRKLENTMASWYKNAPHLPPNGQTWLWRNVWWIDLIGVILSGFFLLSVIAALVTLVGLAVLFGGYGAEGAAVAASLTLLITVFSLFSSLVTFVLTALAIKPLKELKKRGWEYLFIATLISYGLSILGGIISINIFGLIFSLIFAAITFYFLFEIRDKYSNVVEAEVKPVEPAPATPKADV